METAGIPGAAITLEDADLIASWISHGQRVEVTEAKQNGKNFLLKTLACSCSCTWRHTSCPTRSRATSLPRSRVPRTRTKSSFSEDTSTRGTSVPASWTTEEAPLSLGMPCVSWPSTTSDPSALSVLCSGPTRYPPPPLFFFTRVCVCVYI